MRLVGPLCSNTARRRRLNSIATADPLPSAAIFQAAEEQSSLAFRAIADKLEREPRLLAIPLANIARWLANGHSSVARLNGWRAKIENAMESPAGMALLLALLRDESAPARQWKGFSPFPGVLTPDELDALQSS